MSKLLFNNYMLINNLIDLHNPYVIIPTDKAYFTVIFVCKTYYFRSLERVFLRSSTSGLNRPDSQRKLRTRPNTASMSASQPMACLPSRDTRHGCSGIPQANLQSTFCGISPIVRLLINWLMHYNAFSALMAM